MECIINNVSLLLVAVAAVCTVTSIITQITKEIGFLKKIHTSLQVTMTSIVLVVVGTIAYLNYKDIKVVWYMIFAAIVGGIVCAYITMFGWDNLFYKFKSYYKKDLKNITDGTGTDESSTTKNLKPDDSESVEKIEDTNNKD